MSQEYSDTLCKERHERINETLGNHATRINKHGERLDKLEIYQSKTEVELRNLIKKIDDLIGILKWFLLGLLGAGGSFIVWYIQSLGGG